MESYSEGPGGASNGGMLYHEVQESKLCAVHCVNTVLQGPFFSEFDLAAVASDLDRTERQMMLGSFTGDFLPDLSNNMSLDGGFSIQRTHQGANQQHCDQYIEQDEAKMLQDDEDEDLKAAIAAGLMDSSPAIEIRPAPAPAESENENSGAEQA